jgi:hypothetical protein
MLDAAGNQAATAGLRAEGHDMGWRVGLAFWAMWVGVTALISGAGFSIYTWGYFATGGWFSPVHLAGFAVAALLVLPVAQAALLRPHLALAWHWIPASIIGGALGWALILVVQLSGFLTTDAYDLFSAAFWRSAALVVVAGLAVGVFEARVLGAASRRAGWWRPMPAVSNILVQVGSVYLYWAIWAVSPAVGGLLLTDGGRFAFFVANYAVGAAMPALVLVWILRAARPTTQPVPASSAAAQVTSAGLPARRAPGP